MPEGSSDGIFLGDDRPPRWARPRLGVVVAWCLTIAALLSIAAVVCQVAVFSGIRITSRIIQFSLLARYQVALVVAAAVALSITGSGSREGVPPSPVRRLADGALAVCAAGALAANVYAIATFLSDGNLGKTDFSGVDATSRVGLTAVAVAGAVLGAVALYVIGRGGRATTQRSAADGAATAGSERGAIELRSRRLLDPVVACLVVATVVLLAEVLTAVFPKQGQSFGLGGDFSPPGPSVGNRLGSAANSFNVLPIAFAALAVVVLVVARSRSAPRDGFSEVSGAVAAIVGVVAVGAAGYGAWRGTQGSVLGGTFAWWARGSALGTAFSSGALGAAAVYANRQRALTTRVESAVTQTRFNPSVVGLGLAIAALGSAGYVVTPLVNSYGPGVAKGDFLLFSGPYILTIVGLAFAAVIVMTSSRRAPSEPTEHDAKSNSVDVITGAVALATLVSAVYVIVYVIGHKDSNRVPTADVPLLVLDQSGTAQKVGYIGLALAYGIIATGALLLISQSRRPPDDDDPGDEVPVVELVP